MRVDTNKPFVLVYSLNLDADFGAIIEPYVVQLNDNHSLSLSHQHVYEQNIELFETVIDTLDRTLIKLCNEIQLGAIIKLSAKKDMKPSDFMKKVFNEQIFKEVIKPYIENRLNRIIELLGDNKPLYLRNKTGNPAQSIIEIVDEEATAHFHFKRDEHGILYYPTFRLFDEKISFHNKNAQLITSAPCRVLMDDKLILIDKKINGAKIKPFFTKFNIQIPKSAEKTYFEVFIQQVVENHKVISEGFQIREYYPKPKSIIKIIEAWNGEFQIQLFFEYGRLLLPSSERKSIKVTLEKRDNDYIYHKTHRDVIYENTIRTLFKKLGLERIENDNYILPSNNQSFSALVNWINTHIEVLKQENISFKNENTERDIFIGTIKLQFTVNERNDWFDVHALVYFGDIAIPFIKLKRYILNNIQEFILPNGKVAYLPAEWYGNYKEALIHSSIDEENDEVMKINKFHFSIINNVFEVETTGVDLSNTNLDKVDDTEIPSLFQNILRPYQKEGFKWMYLLQKNNFGGILADDMGLGKTVQTLSLLQKAVDSYKISDSLQTNPLFNELKPANNSTKFPSLVVMPTSLIHNWYAEIKKFTPKLKCLTYTGLDRKNYLRYFNNYDVILTTYGTIRNDVDELKNFKFLYIILDESQVIKNPVAKITKSIKELQSKYRLSLTGTPIENSLTDLWSQMSFLNPGILGSYFYFKDAYVQPIEKKNDTEQRDKLRQLISPFILRRTKNEVAKDLPELMQKIYYSEMSKAQRTKYEEVRNFYRNQILSSIDRVGEVKSQFFILKGLMQLRLIANHPVLDDENYLDESGKFQDITQTLLNVISENHKVLVFSQFVKHLKLFEHFCAQNNIPYALLTGKSTNREKEINKFKQDDNIKVFLISLKAGGVGLNLTEADYVFLCDPWWNPASELQAINRAHRIGQDKNVFAYRFISNDTVEEKIVKLQEKKLMLSRDLIDIQTEDNFITREEVEDLFS